MSAMSDCVAAHAAEKVLVLRSCRADGGSHNDWKYPLTEGASIEAPDWNPKPECGGGFHGLLWGDGDYSLLCWEMDAWWQVFECAASDVIAIDTGKVKFRRGVQVFLKQGLSPGLPLALAYIQANGRRPKAPSPNIASGYGSTAASSGYGSTAASSGDRSTAASSGYGSKAASSGYWSKAASSGDKTMAASVGIGGLAKAGPGGCIAVGWLDAKANRPRLTVGYVGENGVKPDTWYSADERGKLVER